MHDSVGLEVEAMLSFEASSMIVNFFFPNFFNGFERLRIFIEERGGLSTNPS